MWPGGEQDSSPGGRRRRDGRQAAGGPPPVPVSPAARPSDQPGNRAASVRPGCYAELDKGREKCQGQKKGAQVPPPRTGETPAGPGGPEDQRSEPKQHHDPESGLLL